MVSVDKCETYRVLGQTPSSPKKNAISTAAVSGPSELGVGRIGCTHDLAVLQDRVLALQSCYNDRSRHHVTNEVVVKRPFLMNGVEALSLIEGQMYHPCRHNLQSGFLETTVDLANQVLLHAIRLNDGERLLNGHTVFLSVGAPHGRDCCRGTTKGGCPL